MSNVTACAKCGSEKIVPRVRIRDLVGLNLPPITLTIEVHENPDALLFKETFRDELWARVCGECGYAELYADNPRELFAAYERSKQPRD